MTPVTEPDEPGSPQEPIGDPLPSTPPAEEPPETPPEEDPPAQDPPRPEAPPPIEAAGRIAAILPAI